MIIVGFDPASLVNLGWSCLTLPDTKKKIPVCEAGTFVFSGAPQAQTLHSLYEMVDNFLSEIDPDIVVIEKTSSFSGGFVTGQVSACIGVLLCLCGKHSIETVEVFPTHVKKVVTGSGRANKKLVKSSVKEILASRLGFGDIEFKSDHAYDACSNILCYLIEHNLLPKSKKEGEGGANGSSPQP